jgi:hypothetical protein
MDKSQTFPVRARITEKNQRASRNGPVSELLPQNPTRKIRNFSIAGAPSSLFDARP